MAIVTSFFDQQKAGEINSIINNNFQNVAKYIPVHFDSLTTIERLNLGDDWKQDGKLVYDIDQERIFIWDEARVEWVEHLLEARDSYARALAEETRRLSFSSVTIDENFQMIFKNALGAQVGSQLLTSDKIQYDSTDSVFSKIGKLLEEDSKLEGEIADIDTLLGDTELPTDNQTVTGAILEIHGEVDTNTQAIADINNGTTSVPSAQHAINADMATDSENLGGQPPSYYAKQSDLNSTNQNVADNTSNISANLQRIEELQTSLDETNETVASNWADYESTKEIVLSNGDRLDTVETDIASLKGAVIPKGSVPTVDENNPENTLTQYIYDTYFNGIIYKGKTALTEGNEQTELTSFVGGTPENNWAVLDTATQNTWVYNSESTTWTNSGILIKTGWAVRDAETSDMWVYESDTSTWVNFGGSFEIKIATTTTAGTVMATEDVNVDGTTGAMSVPKLNNKAEVSETISTVTSAQNSNDSATTLTFSTSTGGTRSTISLPRKTLGHKISSNVVMTDRTTLQFIGNLTVSDDEAGDKTVINVTGGTGSVTGVKLVDEDYSISLTTSAESYTSPVLTGYNSNTDTIKLFMNGAYMSKSNYSLSVNNSNVATITNLNHDTAPWQTGWELTLLVTRIQTTLQP